ncbi:hypothetical protein [Leptospira mayottensis]|uniref:Uncharacterized protein n=1 Tax=Leptospira mayottensis 200901122 TaxID=1193010 RepID=A0AA87SVM3_9LEPT|nr:hypothetical protein [Leptospira mayottensis]EKR99237.1 hypothetical protein LEP1GSC125_3642 [Leptospira mayottensis 200901122]
MKHLLDLEDKTSANLKEEVFHFGIRKTKMLGRPTYLKSMKIRLENESKIKQEVVKKFITHEPL